MTSEITKHPEIIEPPSLLTQLFCLLLPFTLTPVMLWVISLLYGEKSSVELVSLGVASFFGLGKFIVFAPLVELPQINFKITWDSPYHMAAMVIYMDTMTGILIAYNFHLLEKIYVIGPKLHDVRADCHDLLRANKWMRKFSVIGIVLFVSFPISGTGAIGGAFLAGLLGLSRLKAVFWIFVGSIVGSGGIAYGAIAFREKLKQSLESPWFIYLTVALAIVVLILAGIKLKRMIQEQRESDSR